MKHIKLFEELTIEENEFPKHGYKLNSRENKILVDLVGEKFLKGFKIRKEDNYYYILIENHYNQFDGFNELKDYLLCRYYISKKELNNILELLELTDLDPSFDNNLLIRWASRHGHTEVVKLLLKDSRVDPNASRRDSITWASMNGHTEVVRLLIQDSRVDPSDYDNYCIKYASINGHTEVVKLLLKDPRVRKKLSSEEINKYTNEIS